MEISIFKRAAQIAGKIREALPLPRKRITFSTLSLLLIDSAKKFIDFSISDARFSMSGLKILESTSSFSICPRPNLNFVSSAFSPTYTNFFLNGFRESIPAKRNTWGEIRNPDFDKLQGSYYPPRCRRSEPGWIIFRLPAEAPDRRHNIHFDSQRNKSGQNGRLIICIDYIFWNRHDQKFPLFSPLEPMTCQIEINLVDGNRNIRLPSPISPLPALLDGHFLESQLFW